MVVGSQVIANEALTVTASSLMAVGSNRVMPFGFSVVCGSTVFVYARLKWEEAPDQPETWSPIGDVDESWAPLADSSTDWSEISDTPDDWEPVADQSEIWQLAA
jgi:hypothetical protein